MSAHELGKDGPLSRRGFLRTTAESAAAAIAAGTFAGCQSQGVQSKGIYPKYLVDEKPEATAPEDESKIDHDRQISADEGDQAVDLYLKNVLKVDKHDDNTTLGIRPDGIHRVQLMADGTDPVIYMLVMGTHEHAPDVLNTNFSYKYKSIDRKDLKIKYHHAKIPKGHIKAGELAKYPNSRSPGTAGWNLFFTRGTGPQEMVCMSALHAISAIVNPDVTQQPAVQLYAPNGTPANNAKLIYCRQLLIPPDDNLFDLGLARYNTPGNADNSCVTCGVGCAHEGSAYTRPPDIAYGVVTSSTDMYHRSGASVCNCGKGYCIGTGAACAVMLWNTRYLFRSCLVYQRFAIDGDSGAIIVRGSDGKAAGIHFTGDPPSGTFLGDSISCRLELLNWQLGNPNNGFPSFSEP